MTRQAFGSLTAQEVRREYEECRLPTITNNANLKAPISTRDGPGLRNFINASIRVAQTNTLKTIQDRLA